MKASKLRVVARWLRSLLLLNGLAVHAAGSLPAAIAASDPVTSKAKSRLDIDGDGIPNGKDPDIDGDGIPNGKDRDVDGDGRFNGSKSEKDIDGDGIPDTSKREKDIDGDGLKDDHPKEYDIDGDQIENENDPDMDGDGKKNGPDKDQDGDGIPDERSLGFTDYDFNGDGVIDYSYENIAYDAYPKRSKGGDDDDYSGYDY